MPTALRTSSPIGDRRIHFWRRRILVSCQSGGVVVSTGDGVRYVTPRWNDTGPAFIRAFGIRMSPFFLWWTGFGHVSTGLSNLYYDTTVTIPGSDMIPDQPVFFVTFEACIYLATDI